MIEKKLPETTTINGYPYQLIQRDDFRAIYRQTISPTRDHFEVFRIRISNPRMKLAALYTKKGSSSDHLPDKAESFPGDEDFGKTAWSCFTLEDALKRYDAIKLPTKDTVATSRSSTVYPQDPATKACSE